MLSKSYRGAMPGLPVRTVRDGGLQGVAPALYVAHLATRARMAENFPASFCTSFRQVPDGI
jgi:hypothetical protein